ncbi:TPA: Nucleoside diphosphate kinase II, chloroplastic [Trebouxia sp. C0005]
MIKPDGVQRALVGEIIHRFERKGFTLKALKMFVPSKELAEEHYKDLSSKPFFPKLVDYIISGPVIAMVWEGDGVVKSARKLIGATNPLEAEAGTIRGDLAIQTGRNVVHGSDSPENGVREASTCICCHCCNMASSCPHKRCMLHHHLHMAHATSKVMLLQNSGLEGMMTWSHGSLPSSHG